jgi:hypothetical protein
LINIAYTEAQAGKIKIFKDMTFDSRKLQYVAANLEIKPDDEKIDKYLKGDSIMGNAVTDKDGKALGNVGKSKLGDKFKKNYDENLYGAEQMNVSYKRQSQPVDVAGEKKESGSLKSKRGGQNSTEKAQNIMNKLESLEDKKLKVVSEEMNKMKNLISYDRKTQ